MSDAYFEIRIKRSVSFAVLLSVLVHLLALFLLSRQDLLNQHQPAAAQQTMVVNLGPKQSPKPLLEKPAEPLPVPPKPPIVAPKVKPVVMPHPEAPHVLATTKPSPVTTPTPTTPPATTTPKPPALDPSHFPDMASYLNAVRESRHASGEPSTGAAHGTPEDDARSANIQRNLQQSGTNGVFMITSMDAHTATFSFRGWKNEYSYSRREVYQVDVGMNGDVQRAVIRKMIEIIRRYYNGDFNWESHRLDREVVLSARPQDDDGLEDFMMQEFFGPRGVYAR